MSGRIMPSSRCSASQTDAWVPDFFEALYGHLLLSGNAYVEPMMVGGNVRELHLLRPDRIGIVEGRDGWPEAYDYRAGGSVRRSPAETEGLGLIHLKLFHPLDIISVSRRLRPPRWRSISPMRRRPLTRRCSTIRPARQARWSTSRRRAAISRPTSTSG
jgi:hypothetical protein